MCLVLYILYHISLHNATIIYRWYSFFLLQKDRSCKRLAITLIYLCVKQGYPFFYSEEVWSRTEYPVASTLIYEGYIEEGLTIAKAVRERYDGIKRNPWNEFECGWHYSGTMGSWGLLLALSGQYVNLPDGKIYFSPKINQDDFRCFWSTGKAWGIYTQKKDGDDMKVNFEVLYGEAEGIELMTGT